MLDDTRQVLRPLDRKPTLSQLCDIAEDVGAAIGKTKQTFPPLRQEAVEVVGELIRIHDPDQLHVVFGEHQAVVGRAPADMATTRAGRKAEPLPVSARRFQIVDTDQDMVEGLDDGSHADASRIRPATASRRRANSGSRAPGCVMIALSRALWHPASQTAVRFARCGTTALISSRARAALSSSTFTTCSTVTWSCSSCQQS